MLSTFNKIDAIKTLDVLKSPYIPNFIEIGCIENCCFKKYNINLNKKCIHLTKENIIDDTICIDIVLTILVKVFNCFKPSWELPGIII